MAIREIVTSGYGNGTFNGTIPFVVLSGYIPGIETDPPVFTGTIPDITGSVGDSDIVTDLSAYFTGATSYSINPTVEAGWSFNTGTGVLTVDTDFGVSFGPYVITATNGIGDTNSNNFTVSITFTSAATPSGNKRTLSLKGTNRETITKDRNRVLLTTNTGRKLN